MAGMAINSHIDGKDEQGRTNAMGNGRHEARQALNVPSSFEDSLYHNTDEHDFLAVRDSSRPRKARSEHSVMVEPAAAYRRGHVKHRKLVLCFDGTGNKFHGDDSDSNILKIFRMLDRTANDQYHYYQPGIGTYVVSKSLSHTSLRSRIRSWYMKAKDSAVGSSFDEHVVGGYRFLMRFYAPGDEIYIFGFSRGSYIARFLAEMLDYVGLLSHGNEEMVPFAWKAFSQWQCRRSAGEDDIQGRKKKAEMYAFMKGFRETFSRPVRRIRFLGLFDTVNSVPRFETAWMERSKFPYTARSSAKVIRHAVSIDERRAKFRQDLMYQSRDEKKSHAYHHDPLGQMMHDIHEKYRHRSGLGLGLDASHRKDYVAQTEDRGRRPSKVKHFDLPLSGDRTDPMPFRQRSRSRSRTTHRTCDTTSQISVKAPYDDGDGNDDDDWMSESEADQDMEEVWFSGGHGDIGGGWAVEPGTKSSSHVPLVWMVREAIKAGLTFDVEKVVAMGCSEALGDSTTDGSLENENGKGVTTLPDIRISASSPPKSPRDEKKGETGGQDISPTTTVTDRRLSPFHEMMHKAHTARIHDSLNFDCGMSFSSVVAWKFMEYLPFRRMDLQSDGSWKPIRWPLPCGEVRDIPDNVKVHGSVIRRMQSDDSYRPGNLIVGGGGRGCRRAPESYGMGDWECIANPGDPVSEIWTRRGQKEG